MESSIVSTFFLPVVIGLIMFNLGLSLTFRDFKRIFIHPRALIIGLCCQMLLLPLIAFLLAYFSNLAPPIKVGLVLIAACPGGATSNLITYLLKGEVALSISLTSINSLLILFSIPGITYLALQAFLDKDTIVALPLYQTILKILLMIILPTFGGLLMKKYVSRTAEFLERYLKYITTALLALVFIIAILYNTGDQRPFEAYLRIIPYAFALNVAGMFSGLLAGYLARFDKSKIITLTVEIGIQNSALAITIATSSLFLDSPEMALPAVVYGMFTFFNAAILGLVIKKWY